MSHLRARPHDIKTVGTGASVGAASDNGLVSS